MSSSRFQKVKIFLHYLTESSAPAASKLHLFKTFGWAGAWSYKGLKSMKKTEIKLHFMNHEF